MRILVVCQYYYPEPFRITDICETLVQNGHQVTVLTGLPNYPEGYVLDEYRRGMRRCETINGVTIIRNFEIGRGHGRVRLFLNYLSYAVSASIKVMNLKEEFDVVYVNQLSPVMMAIPALVYKKKFKKKVLLYCLDLWPESLAAGGITNNSFIYKVFRSISKKIYESADKILVTSDMFRDYFDKVLDIDPENIDHLPQYAEELFSENLEVETKIREEEFNFVFAGNVGEVQSVDTIVRAANELKNYDNIKFHIIGDGAKLGDCKQLAHEYNLGNVLFYGRLQLEEMPRYYSMASAMLITLKDNTALSYTLPGKIQSYMAAGKPVIGSVNGETARIIQNSGCGFCCAAEDYKELAKALTKFCESKNKLEMASNAKNYYLNNFSKNTFITSINSALENLAC